MRPHQEPERVPTGRVAIIGVGVVVISAVIVLIAIAIGPRVIASEATAGRRVPERLGRMPTNLFLSPVTTGIDRLRRQRQTLTRYGWTDRQRNEVRVPLDQAVELFLSGARATDTGAKQ